MGTSWELRRELHGNVVGTLWELEESHGNVVGTSWVPWELVGNSLNFVVTCGNFVGTLWELRGNLMGTYVETSWEL